MAQPSDTPLPIPPPGNEGSPASPETPHGRQTKLPIGTVRRTVATAVIAITAGTIALYVLVMRSQDDSPRAWVVGTLALALALAMHGGYSDSHLSRTSMLISSLLLIAMGAIGIFSVGLPLLVAGIIAGFAASQSPRARPS